MGTPSVSKGSVRDGCQRCDHLSLGYVANTVLEKWRRFYESEELSNTRVLFKSVGCDQDIVEHATTPNRSEILGDFILKRDESDRSCGEEFRGIRKICVRCGQEL